MYAVAVGLPLPPDRSVESDTQLDSTRLDSPAAEAVALMTSADTCFFGRSRATKRDIRKRLYAKCNDDE